MALAAASSSFLLSSHHWKNLVSGLQNNAFSPNKEAVQLPHAKAAHPNCSPLVSDVADKYILPARKNAPTETTDALRRSLQKLIFTSFFYKNYYLSFQI